MKILKIAINDFRSLGNEHNYITMTDDVIAIVGKNGSGKSNILAALDGLQFFRQASKKTLDNRNRFIDRSSARITIDVEILPEDYASLTDDKALLPTKIETVRFKFFKHGNSGYFMSFHAMEDGTPSANTFFSRLLETDEKMMECFPKLLAAAKKENTQNWQPNDLNSRENVIFWAEHYTEVFISKIDFNWLKRYARDIPEVDIKYLQEKHWEFMLSFAKIMPRIFIYQDEELFDSYRREELEKENGKFFSTSSALNKLISALGETPDTFLQAMGNQQTPECQSIQRRFRKKLDKFNKLFNEKYNNNAEQVETDLHFDHEQCVISVATNDNDMTFKFSERSNGLKWYIGFFTALQSAGILGKALLLIDEPAVHLHVDAQKEVLQLFDNLVREGHQLIYTTHSPAMLDINRWERIRTVEKECNISRIYMLHDSHSGEKRLETLSPVQQAMGCSLKNTLAPDAERMNLITEGITDYYYCKAMLKICDMAEEKQPFVIPACGADNTPNLMVILFGWGYNFRVLLDNDTEGKKVKRRLQKELGEIARKYVFSVSDHDSEMIEDLLSNRDREAYKKVNSKGEFQKTLSAIDFMHAVLKGEYVPEKETVDNFRTLFARMGLI